MNPAFFEKPNISPEMAERRKSLKMGLEQLQKQTVELRQFQKLIDEQSIGISSQDCEKYFLIDKVQQALDEKKSEAEYCPTCDIFSGMKRISVFNDKNFEEILAAVISGDKLSLFKEIGLTCDKKDQYNFPSNIICNEPSFVENNADGSYKNATQEDVLRIRHENSPRILKSLKNGRAVGYSFCTNILEDPNASYLTTPNREEKMCRVFHGHHAVAIMGARCEKGQVRYLIQNSWGTNWKPTNQNLTSEPGGKFWMTEQDMFSNVESFSYLDNQD